MDGYLYVVNGRRQYMAEAVQSVASLRRHDTGAHITLITNALAAETHRDMLAAFDDVLVREGPPATSLKDAWLYKSSVIGETPYDRTFFVDSDTCFLGSCR